MSKEFSKHIFFEPFERERTSTISVIQGTGLGMITTKNIIDTMSARSNWKQSRARERNLSSTLIFVSSPSHRVWKSSKNCKGCTPSL